MNGRLPSVIVPVFPGAGAAGAFPSVAPGEPNPSGVSVVDGEQPAAADDVGRRVRAVPRVAGEQVVHALPGTVDAEYGVLVPPIGGPEDLPGDGSRIRSALDLRKPEVRHGHSHA